MTLRIPAKELLHMWSYDFYDMTLSTGKQRRHMIKIIKRLCFHYMDSTIPPLAFFCYRTGHFVSDLVGSTEDRFSRVVAHISI